MYTKGEWNTQLAQPYEEHEFEITYDTKDGLTYTVADIIAFNGEDAEANAHLISAAPIGHKLAEAILNNMPRAHLEKVAMEFMDKAKIDY